MDWGQVGRPVRAESGSRHSLGARKDSELQPRNRPSGHRRSRPKGTIAGEGMEPSTYGVGRACAGSLGSSQSHWGILLRAMPVPMPS